MSTHHLTTDDAPSLSEHVTEMIAVVQSAYGNPSEVLHAELVESPSVGAHDVLVRVMATTVNTPDWAAVIGVPTVLRLQTGLRRPRTGVRGTDVAGVVEAVGEHVTDFRPGDEVFGSTSGGRAGTFAELTVVPAVQLAHKPPSVSFEHAAAAVMSGITALVAIRDAGAVQPGTRVLINGASGGVGTFAVQLASARGAHVTGVASAANAELVRSLGADEVIAYDESSFLERDERYDVVLDNVMNHPPRRVAEVLADDGVLIPNSLGSGTRLLGGLPRMFRAMLLGLGPTTVRTARFLPDRDDLEEMGGLLESGAVRAVIDSVHDLDRSADAVSRMLTHRARGNVVILPAPVRDR